MERKDAKIYAKKRIFPACLFLMFVLMILVIGKETDMTGRGETQKIRNLSDGWYYLKDGERTEVTLPTTLQEDPGTVLELYNDTVTDENRDMVLLTWEHHITCRSGWIEKQFISIANTDLKETCRWQENWNAV